MAGHSLPADVGDDRCAGSLEGGRRGALAGICQRANLVAKKLTPRTVRAAGMTCLKGVTNCNLEAPSVFCGQASFVSRLKARENDVMSDTGMAFLRSGSPGNSVTTAEI